jgi:4-alpha-glucanotransferase
MEGFESCGRQENVRAGRAPRRCPAGSSTSSQEGGRVRRSAEFPELADVSVATHDLATMRGYWAENDVAARTELGMYKSADEEATRADRARDKQLLLQAHCKEGLGDPGRAAWTPGLSNAIHIYLARPRAER